MKKLVAEIICNGSFVLIHSAFCVAVVLDVVVPVIVL